MGLMRVNEKKKDSQMGTFTQSSFLRFKMCGVEIFKKLQKNELNFFKLFCTQQEGNSPTCLSSACLHTKTKKKQHRGLQEFVLCEQPLKD